MTAASTAKRLVSIEFSLLTMSIATVINGEPNYMWADVLTREQFVTVLYRFAKLMGRA